MTENRKITKFQLLLEAHIENMGKQERKVAEYLSENESVILKSSVSDIANTCSVSQATVVRLCKTLGFSGLKDFKIFYRTGKLQEDIYNKDITWDDGDEEIYHKVFYKTISTLETSFQSISFETLGKIADQIVRAQNIDIVGIGGSAQIVQYFRNEFIRLGKRINAYTDSYALSHTMSAFDNLDLIIAISCSGETQEILNFMKQAKSKNIAMIAMTNHNESTLSKIVDHTIATCEKHFFVDEVNTFSRIAQISMINSLYIMTAARLGQKQQKFKESYIDATNYKKFQ